MITMLMERDNNIVSLDKRQHLQTTIISCENKCPVKRERRRRKNEKKNYDEDDEKWK